jgi:hypothetical protein
MSICLPIISIRNGHPEDSRTGQSRSASTLEVTDAILQSKPHPEQGYRACLGLLNLAKKYGESRLEQACRRAIDIGNPCRASVKSLLHTHLDNAPKVDDVETPNLTHHNIRGPKYYK